MASHTDIRTLYERDGYVIIPGLIPASERQKLGDACTGAETLTRAGKWPFRRSVGKQFPPYGDEPDSWGIQHVMHPDLHEPAFMEWYCSDAICDVTKTLLGCGEEDLQMGVYILMAAYSWI